MEFDNIRAEIEEKNKILQRYDEILSDKASKHSLAELGLSIDKRFKEIMPKLISEFSEECNKIDQSKEQKV